MTATAIDRELQTFAVELFERSGGVADWAEPDLPGSVVMPPEVGLACPCCRAKNFPLCASAVPGSLHVGLAGEFLDVAARVLDQAVPREGAFCIPDRYLTSRDLTDKIGQTFGWQNARAKYQPAEPALVEYHLWTLFWLAPGSGGSLGIGLPHRAQCRKPRGCRIAQSVSGTRCDRRRAAIFARRSRANRAAGCASRVPPASRTRCPPWSPKANAA